MDQRLRSVTQDLDLHAQPLNLMPAMPQLGTQ
jgi:hypothetical protein